MASSVSERPPVFTLDTILAVLERTVLKPSALGWLPLLSLAWAVRSGKARLPQLILAPSELFEQSTHVLNLIQLTVFAQKAWTAIPRWLKRAYAALVLLRLHRIATRYVKNLGRFRADPIDYRRDVIVITGGSAGIGKSMVERFSKLYGAKIAVIDMGAPTYAPARPGSPEILFIKADITRKEAVASAAEQIRKHFGRDPSVLSEFSTLPLSCFREASIFYIVVTPPPLPHFFFFFVDARKQHIDDCLFLLLIRIFSQQRWHLLARFDPRKVTGATLA